ncbi:MAG: zinc-ribbon domain-containing protein, partial [Clostridia bacterium]|nr:zinc-ribbon domain-containing protein [Clostridia bacterium]
MFFIWGFGKRSNYTGELVKDTCGNCGTEQNMNILTEYNYGSLFFIPILKMNRKYYIVCQHCGAGKQIGKK